MKSLTLAVSLALTASAASAITLDYQSPTFTSGAYAGQSVIGTIVLDESALYAGLGQEYIPTSESFTVGGHAISNLTTVQVYFQQNNDVLQNYDIELRNASVNLSIQGSLADDGMHGFTILNANTCTPSSSWPPTQCAQGSRVESPGVWSTAQPITGQRVMAAPEINTGGAAAGLTLFAGMLAVMTGRRRVKASV